MRKIRRLSGAAARTGRLNEKERRNDENIKRKGIGGFQKKQTKQKPNTKMQFIETIENRGIN